jgi:hypothetical protein
MLLFLFKFLKLNYFLINENDLKKTFSMNSDQYTTAYEYVINTLKNVSISMDHVPMNILHSIVMYVQTNPHVEEKQIMHKFMNYPIHPYNFQHMHGFYKDIYVSTRVYSILSNLYIKSSDIDERLFGQISLFVEDYPNASNSMILEKIYQIQHQ